LNCGGNRVTVSELWPKTPHTQPIQHPPSATKQLGRELKKTCGVGGRFCEVFICNLQHDAVMTTCDQFGKLYYNPKTIHLYPKSRIESRGMPSKLENKVALPSISSSAKRQLKALKRASRVCFASFPRPARKISATDPLVSM